jgi:hypothetical protein
VRRLLFFSIAVAIIALVGPPLAQSGPVGEGVKAPKGGLNPQITRRGMGLGGAATLLIRLYDPKTVTTVAGGVESLGTLPPQGFVKGAIRSAGLKTEQGEITVYLSPEWYLHEHKIYLTFGDKVEVTGSKVIVGGQPAVIAKDLKVGDKTLTLRTDQGLPVWRSIPSSGGAPVRSP